MAAFFVSTIGPPLVPAPAHWVVGLFLWKAFPGRTRGEDFPALLAPQRPVLERAWRREPPR